MSEEQHFTPKMKKRLEAAIDLMREIQRRGYDCMDKADMAQRFLMELRYWDEHPECRPQKARMFFDDWNI